MKHLPEHIQKHIQTVPQQEKEFLSRQTTLDKLAHVTGGFVGSFPFILLDELV